MGSTVMPAGTPCAGAYSRADDASQSRYKDFFMSEKVDVHPLNRRRLARVDLTQGATERPFLTKETFMPDDPTRDTAQGDAAAATAITSLRELAKAEGECTRCPLYKDATQAVPGEGRKHAHLMLVGEQPGDKEDLAGKPFVGPAGHMLDRALAEAGIDRADVFVTNAVKHFKHEM